MLIIGWSIVGLGILSFVASFGVRYRLVRGFTSDPEETGAGIAFVSIFLVIVGLLVVARAVGVNEI